MKIVGSHLEKGWGDSVDNPKIADVETAIKETQKMDDEHGAFWVSVFREDDKEVVLEASKNLWQTLILDPKNLDSETFNEKKNRAQNREEVLENYRLLLNGEVDKVEERMNK